MFYGGHGTGESSYGFPVWSLAGSGNQMVDCQICLMTSGDGRHWTRYSNEKGQSRLFIGPGESRDPCLIKIDGLWHMYYAGYHAHQETRPGYFVRTSTDFGIGNAYPNYVGSIDVGAPEIIVDTKSGQEYITSNHDLDGRTRMCKLRWES